jgi:hypothetical protein
MSNRLDKDREAELQPKRLDYAKEKILALGLKIIHSDATRIDFMFKGSKISFFPYSGWATGKPIEDGRGLQNLLNQLSQSN